MCLHVLQGNFLHAGVTQDLGDSLLTNSLSKNEEARDKKVIQRVHAIKEDTLANKSQSHFNQFVARKSWH